MHIGEMSIMSNSSDNISIINDGFAMHQSSHGDNVFNTDYTYSNTSKVMDMSIGRNHSNISMFNQSGMVLNDSGHTSITFPPLTYIYVTVTILDILVFLIGVAGNVLVLIVIARQVEMRTATNIFLANLSVADLLVLLLCMPSALLEFHARDAWHLGHVMCKLVPMVEHTVSFTSILTISAISFERYYAICCPLQVLYTCTKRRAVKIVSALWVCGIISAVPFAVISYLVADTRVDTNEPILVCIAPVNSTWKQAYVVSTIVVFFALPFGLLSGLYIIIGRQLIKDSHGKTFNYSQRQSQRPQAARKQIIYMLIAVIVLFFICMLPLRTVTLWMVFSTSKDIENLGLEGYLNLTWFARIMFYINSAGNPVLYNVVSTKFRDACKKCLGFSKQRESNYMSMTCKTTYMSRTVSNSMADTELDLRTKSFRSNTLTTASNGIKEHEEYA